MHDRRPMGGLETAVLTCLWAADGPMSAREVLAAVDPDLAYTTVLTVLTRLGGKGLVERERSGRAFRYRARFGEADLIAGQMAGALAAADDRRATLSRFVEALSPAEANALRSLLDDIERDRSR